MLLFGGLLLAANTTCPAGFTVFEGSTNCNPCKNLQNFDTKNSSECCSRCGANPECDSWTLQMPAGICRLKNGATADPSKKNPSISGTRTLQPTPAPTQPPTPGHVPAPAGAKNVLFIIVDDLRPELGAYGMEYARTPNLDSFAKDAMLFQRAYVQYSFCAPSRNSFMTGRRPDTTQVFNFVDHFRSTHGKDWASLPQYFKQHGYLTLGTGKLYHPEVPPAKDVPFSWSSDEYPYVSADGCVGASVNNSGVDCVPSFSGCNNKSGEIVAGDLIHWCSVNVSRVKEAFPEYGESPLADMKAKDAAIKFLSIAKNDTKKRPFFIGVGFHKPHLPFASPMEFHTMQLPASQLKPPKFNRPPRNSPSAAWHPGGFGNPACTYNKSVPDDQAVVYRRAYYAAVSYTDALVGEVLQELKDLELEDNTVVLFMGDHGWQLGEMDEWRKMTNWELGVRVPFIIRAPHKPQSHGVKTPALAEAVDLVRYPTLAALAGLPDPKANGENIQGDDLSPLFDAPVLNGTGPKLFAYSQFGKTAKKYGAYGVQPWEPCTKCNRSQWDYMGFSLRDDRWRYTEWVQWNKSTWLPIWGDYGAGGGAELYDHLGDFGADMDAATDTDNLALDPQHAALVAQLSEQLHSHFDNDHEYPRRSEEEVAHEHQALKSS